MAHTKAGGSSKLGRDSEAKRLGLKVFDGDKVKAGQVLIRQRGTKWHAGKNTKQGGDDTIYAATTGQVKFTKKNKITFKGQKKRISVVNIIP
ncbi:MAG: 50S ribosomal protein L27 [Candidatus Pacebacteria bacterium]|mgnify:FL=1|jgi:large subunit ribosomal protein L27|nr:50S ribosomal protein L27 [Candidatus Paceibacterota bacterium]